MGVINTSKKSGAVGLGKGTGSRNPIAPIKLSQTPKNFSVDNYFLKELQDKVDASWNLRPNHVDIEQEMTFGKEDYEAYEVVVQTVKGDNGTIISDDWRRIVFRNIRYDCAIGAKFRIAPGYDLTVPDKDKYIFLVTNKTNELSETNSVVVRRCNGTLGTTYLDSNGVTCYHYEPAIQQGITNTGLHYNEVANDPSAALTVIVQHNQYTKNYYINQRFIVGYDRVYRITNIDKFYSNDTLNPGNVGLITLYMAIDNIGERDDFVKRIAYNQADDINQVEEVRVDDYYIKVASPVELTGGEDLPDVLPIVLVTGYNNFTAYLYNGDEKVTAPIHLDFVIKDLDVSQWDKYVSTEATGDNEFKVLKKKYCTYPLDLRFYLPADESPAGQALETVLTVSLAGIL